MIVFLFKNEHMKLPVTAEQGNTWSIIFFSYTALVVSKQALYFMQFFFAYGFSYLLYIYIYIYIYIYMCVCVCVCVCV